MGAGETQRNNYYADKSSGYISPPAYLAPYKTKAYNCTERPWYIAAVKSKSSGFSAPYTFTNVPLLGITYAVPIIKNNAVVAVIGIDFLLSQLSTSLSNFGRSGSVFYITETQLSGDSANFKMIASSSDANIVGYDETAKENVQLLATESTVQDAFIEVAADYMFSHPIAQNPGRFITQSYVCTVLTYSEHGLNWRFVGVSFEYPRADGCSGGSTVATGTTVTSQGSASPIQVLNVTISSLVLVLLVVLLRNSQAGIGRIATILTSSKRAKDLQSGKGTGAEVRNPAHPRQLARGGVARGPSPTNL